MNKIRLRDFYRGWLVGDFEPSIFRNKEVEVAVQRYRKGDVEPQHYHKVGTEVSVMVFGSAKFNQYQLDEGDGVIIEPGESNRFEALSDCAVLVIKTPSVPGDKFLGENKS